MKRPVRTLLAAGACALLVLAACSDDKKTATTTASSGAGTPKPSISIGAQDFGESKILSEIFKQGLAAKGFPTSIQTLGGFRPLEIPAFDNKTINFAPEYAAAMLEFLNGKKGEASSDVAATVNKLGTQLDAKGLAASLVTNAVNTNGFAMTKAKSDSLQIKTLSDLASKGKSLKLGGPSDCETNPFCIPGLKSIYSLDLSSSFTSMQTSAVPASLDNNEIDVGIIFTTDGVLTTDKYVLLQDDKRMLGADNVIPVMTKELAANNELITAANAISAKITTAELVKLNKRFDIDKEDAAVIAKDFLTQNNLL